MIGVRFQPGPSERVDYFVSRSYPWVVLELTRGWPNAKDLLVSAFGNAVSECQRLAAEKGHGPSWQTLFQVIGQECSAHARRLSNGELTPGDLLAEVGEVRWQLGSG